MKIKESKIQKPAIAVYVPRWLYRNDVGITIFVRGLYRSIQESGKYRLLKISPRVRALRSVDEARAFVEKHNISLVMYHDTRLIAPYKKRDDGLDFLEACVPFLNAASVHVADDKFETKRTLRTLGVPVLPDDTIKNREEPWRAMGEGELYAAKPHNSGSGQGVKLIKKSATDFFEFLDGTWRNIKVLDTTRGLTVAGHWYRTWIVVIFALVVALLVCGYASLIQPFPYSLINLLLIALIVQSLPKVNHNYTYKPLMLEPFFGDGTEEFYCLRCTVLDGKVVEAAKKANNKNVTPNISHGGKATNIILSPEQEAMAVAATKAVGAAFTGVDLLHAGGKTVVCEVNVGPIGVYCEQTGVDVGKMVGEYAMRMCEERQEKTNR